MSTTSKRLRTLVATGTIATTVALVLTGCGARAREKVMVELSGHYDGEHWLGSFAVYLLTEPK